MKMLIKLVQLNMSSTVFNTQMRTLFHCSGSKSIKICFSQLFKLQEHSLTHINYSQWWCVDCSKFYVTTHKKKSHGVRSGDRGGHSISCCNTTTW